MFFVAVFVVLMTLLGALIPAIVCKFLWNSTCGNFELQEISYVHAWAMVSMANLLFCDSTLSVALKIVNFNFDAAEKSEN
jgi:hypothetical protein